MYKLIFNHIILSPTVRERIYQVFLFGATILQNPMIKHLCQLLTNNLILNFFFYTISSRFYEKYLSMVIFFQNIKINE